jgi:transposase-like protein
MSRKEIKPSRARIKAMLSQEEDFLRPLMKAALQEVLEAEMDEALGAAKGTRDPARQGYRSGYYSR